MYQFLARDSNHFRVPNTSEQRKSQFEPRKYKYCTVCLNVQRANYDTKQRETQNNTVPYPMNTLHYTTIHCNVMHEYYYIKLHYMIVCSIQY
jgi:hypothetical protein